MRSYQFPQGSYHLEARNGKGASPASIPLVATAEWGPADIASCLSGVTSLPVCP